MKIIVIGATGTVGKSVVGALKDRHELVEVGKDDAAMQADFTDGDSIRDLFERVGTFDAVVSAAGRVELRDLAEMTETDMWVGLKDKLMGQVNLVLIGQHYIADRGSFTLTSGLLSHDPIPMGTSASMVNGAIDAFVRAAAFELQRGIRINSVSTGLLQTSAAALSDYFRGHDPVPDARAALAYVKSVEGHQTGQTFTVY